VTVGFPERNYFLVAGRGVPYVPPVQVRQDKLAAVTSLGLLDCRRPRCRTLTTQQLYGGSIRFSKP
jgi:hypothetical protein